MKSRLLKVYDLYRLPSQLPFKHSRTLSWVVVILPEHSQRPYRYGMTLLCVCAKFNWLGLADINDESAWMVLILPEHSQRPYRYGMTLLCVGAMFNWLGLADNNAEPVRYIGVTLIAAGAMLICLAMCFWMKATHDPQVAALQAEQDAIHHIVTIHRADSVQEKPPDYDTVTGAAPPSYEEAIKLSPAQLTLDSCRDEVLKPEPEVQSGGSGQSAAIASCQVHISTKPDVGSVEEISVTDNFGTKVLRISRKFLQRTRSVQDMDEESRISSTEQTTDLNITPDVSVR